MQTTQTRVIKQVTRRSKNADNAATVYAASLFRPRVLAWKSGK